MLKLYGEGKHFIIPCSIFDIPSKHITCLWLLNYRPQNIWLITCWMRPLGEHDKVLVSRCRETIVVSASTGPGSRLYLLLRQTFF
jgi:hypothetical protein